MPSTCKNCMLSPDSAKDAYIKTVSFRQTQIYKNYFWNDFFLVSEVTFRICFPVSRPFRKEVKRYVNGRFWIFCWRVCYASSGYHHGICDAKPVAHTRRNSHGLWMTKHKAWTTTCFAGRAILNKKFRQRIIELSIYLSIDRSNRIESI